MPAAPSRQDPPAAPRTAARPGLNGSIPAHAVAPGAGATDPTSAALARRIAAEIEAAGGWISFERYMALALYEPGLGYYANEGRKFGAMPASGSDFVTAPELSPLFALALARQVAQLLEACGVREVWEFGAGSGALAAGLIEALGERIDRYVIVDLSATLRERQAATVAARVPALAHKLAFAERLPDQLAAVVVANELLDAMPVQLLVHDGQAWRERGVALAAGHAAAAPGDGSGGGDRDGDGGARASAAAKAAAASTASTTATPTPDTSTPGAPAEAPRFCWQDRPTEAAPPVDLAALLPPGALAGYLTELGRQGCGFVRSLAASLLASEAAGLGRGALLLIDYGFPEAEYYLPERRGGTLVAHRAHQVETDPEALLAEPGRKDLSAHVDFTAIALAGQDAGLDVAGYTSQARFLFNCGITEDLAPLQQAGDHASLSRAHLLLAEHEMGELFKVIAFTTPGVDLGPAGPLGFAVGDRSHRL